MNVDAPTLSRPQLKPRSASAAAWKRFRRQPGAVVGLLITALLIVICVFAPWLAPHDPAVQYPSGLSELGAPLPPTHMFWFGTDALGRDLYSRLIFGTRTSLLIAVLSNLIATSIALVLGTLAGYFGGLADTLIMRLTDVLVCWIWD